MPKLNYFNNTGGINKFSSDASLNESEIKTDWYSAQNVEGHKSGGIIKMRGNINICTTDLPENTKILGIGNYTKGSDYYSIVNTSEGKLYRLDLNNGSLTQIAENLSQTAECCYANYNNGIIITNGIDIPLFYEEGVGASQLSGGAPVGLPIEVYKTRVFIAAGSSLYYSALGNHNDWVSPDAGYISNFHNDPSPIVALKNYGEFLAIYKKKSIYVLTGTSPEDFAISTVSNKGSVSTWGIGTIDNNQYFFDGESITPLRFNELGQIRLADDISIKIKSAFADLDCSKFDRVSCIPYQKKNQIWFYFSDNTSQDLNICYIYDYFHSSWYKRVGIPITCGTVINGNIYTGTSDGRILIEDYGDSFDNDPIEAWWLSPWFTFGYPGIQKEVNIFDIWLYQDQKYPLEVLYSQNYNGEDENYTIVDIVSNTDLIWDIGLWDQDCWSSSKAVRKKIRINGKCESLQIGIRNLQANQPFAVLGYSFDFEVAEP